MDRPSEVSNFGNAERQHDVLWLEIAVYHSVPVQLEKSLADALHEWLPLLLSQFAFYSEQVVELSPCAEL